jgi:hypothetical protein
MARRGVWIDGEVIVRESVRRGRLVLAGGTGDALDAYLGVGFLFLVAAIAASAATSVLVSDHSRFISSSIVGLLSLGYFWSGLWILRITLARRDLIRIDTGKDAHATRAAFAQVADQRGWGRVPTNASYSCHLFDEYVVTVLFRKDHLLLNCRRRIQQGAYLPTRWPLSFKVRAQLVRSIAEDVRTVLARSDQLAEPKGGG